MENIKPYIGIAYLVFLIIYWGGLAILLYHLKRHGTGRHIQSFFYGILVLSIVLTSLATFFYFTI